MLNSICYRSLADSDSVLGSMKRQTFEQPDPTYVKLVEEYSQLLPSPAQRLRFLRSALDRYRTNPLAERLSIVKQITFRKIIIEELVQFLPAGVPKPREITLVFWLYRVRYPVYFTAILLVVAMSAVVLQWSVGQARESGIFQIRFGKSEPTVVVVNNEPAKPPAPKQTQSATESSIEGYPLDKVWLVERTGEYEDYSNGCRILTRYETSTERRDFYALRRKASRPNQSPPVGIKRVNLYPEKLDRPIGLLYHVTQSDLLPFSPRFNQKLKGHTKYLLDYIRQEKLYNYLIDRFGRIYRVVNDEDYANHAGNSVWADTESVYINLNHSFIGIAFEGWWSSDVKLNAEEINQAQIYAGKMLTEVLRSKYQIRDSNCVTHGLVSVNPTDYLIGHHLDWATGFPFTEIGLRDKYFEPPASIAEFGFRYDKAFQDAIGGKLWPGIPLAEARLRARAADSGVSVDTLRKQLQADFTVYRQWQLDMRGQDKDSSAEGTKVQILDGTGSQTPAR